MSSVVIATFLSSFLASAVEFVAATTVVLAVGVTRLIRRTDSPRREIGGTWPNIREPGGSPHVTAGRTPN